MDKSRTASIRRTKIAKSTAFYLGNIIIGVIFVSPLLWMIAASFKPENDVFANMTSILTFIPVNFTVGNYVEVFQRLNIPQILGNTFLYIGLTLVGDLIFGSMCGYALAKLKFRGRGLILTIIIALSSMPVEAILLPLYIEMTQLGWVNTLAGLVFPFMMNCFSIYMFYSNFLDVPDALREAASLDGCGAFRTFISVIMPISKTTYATVFILDFIARWNDFMWPFLVTTGADKRTVQLAVQSFFGTNPVHYGAIMAALTLASLPMLAIYIFMQKYYVQGIAATGIKG